MLLNCHTNFSLKYGTIPLEELLIEAKRNGYKELVLTDINNTSTTLNFIRQAKEKGIKPIVGIDFRNGVDKKFIGIAENNNGFYELNKFLSKHQHEKKDIPEAAPFFESCQIIYPFEKVFKQPPKTYISTLKNNEWVGVTHWQLDKLRLSSWKHYQDRMVLLQPVSFQNKKAFNAHRLLRAVDNNCLLSKLPKSEEGDPREQMLSKEEIKQRFFEFPKLIKNTKKIVDNSEIEFVYKDSKNIKSYTGNEEFDFRFLKFLSERGLQKRYHTITNKITERVNTELSIIKQKGFVSYFLVNWEIAKFARKKGFFQIGRGSGANSIIAYSLYITDVDPTDLDLYFERFINLYRENPPDFDVDFSWKDRDEVIEHIFRKYGTEHTAQIATYSTFQTKALYRELGKVFGLPKAEIDTLSKTKKIPENPDHITRLILKYAVFLHGFPSHLSVHAGGIVVSEKPLHYYTATTLPPKGFPLTHFSMIEAEDIGLYKLDILSQRGLGHIKDTIEIVKENRGEEIDIHNIDKLKKDDRIKELLRNAKTIGCFYVESPAMRGLLTKLRVDNYLGLVAASSIIRPGVAKSGMMREYIQRYRFPEKRKEAHSVMYDLMPETYGVMVYQEDVIKVAHHFAGLSMAEADVLRRGMSGKYRGREEFKRAEEKFFSNCKDRGINDETAKDVWRQIESFAGYAFSKGHSASYAVESYQSLYLKAYYPLEFMVGVINNFGGFYRTEIYVHELRMAGGDVQPPCVNRSCTETVIEGRTVFLGFGLIKDLNRETRDKITIERSKDGVYKNIVDFIIRTEVQVDQLHILIRVGAFRDTNKTKKQLMWEAHMFLGKKKNGKRPPSLFKPQNRKYKLPELDYFRREDSLDERELLNFSLTSPFLLSKGMGTDSIDIQNIREYVGKRIKIYGYFVTSKTTRTSNGKIMFFGTFYDRNGAFIDTVHFPPSAEKFPLFGRGCYEIKGKVVEDFEFPSIEVDFMKRLEMINYEDLEKVEAINQKPAEEWEGILDV